MSETVNHRHEHRLHAVAHPELGRVLLTGRHEQGQGIGASGRLRVYGSYAAVAVTGGSGRYRDTAGVHCEIAPGDILFVFPERAHWYGPRQGRTWDEIYVTFDGPVFDLWRRSGLLDDRRPVRRLGERGVDWARRLERWVAALGSGDDRWALVELLELLDEPLREELAPGAAPADRPERTGAEWLARARTLLETDLAAPLDIRTLAERVGLSYETFRKRFQQATGVSPSRYRTQRRIEAAAQLLRFSPQMTNRQIAEALGFADEYHFSRRFAALAGRSPRDARRAG